MIHLKLAKAMYGVKNTNIMESISFWVKLNCILRKPNAENMGIDTNFITIGLADLELYTFFVLLINANAIYSVPH